MKRFIAVLISVLCIAGCLLPMSVSAGGYGDASTLDAFRARPVSEDLAVMTVDGQPFDLSDYPYDADAEPPIRVLSLYEYGYSDFSPSYDRYGDYSLYLYIYNPRSVPLVIERALSVSLALGDGQYHKYPLTYLSYSGDGQGHDYLFYKFAIEISAEDLRAANTRTYRVSEVEFPERYDSLNATAYRAGMTATYTGTLNGYGSAENTLSSTVVDLNTIDLSVKQVTFRRDKPDLVNNGTSWQINSVLFSIPGTYIEECGDLQAISFEYYKYNTGYVAVFPTERGDRIYSRYEGVRLTELHDDIPALCAGGDDTSYYWVYNNRYGYNTIVTADTLTYVTHLSDGWDLSLNNPGNVVDTDIADHFNDLWQSCKQEDGSFVGSGIFAGDKSEHYVYRYLDNAVDSWEFGTPNPSWLAYLGFRDELMRISPIDYIEQADLDAGIEQSQYIDGYYHQEVQRLLNEAENADKRLCVLRYDLTDYFALNTWSDSSLGETDNYLTGKDDGGFVAKEDIYMDFDILSLTFRRDGESTVIPAVMSPMNIIPDLETPFGGGGGDGETDWWLWIVIGAVSLIALVVLMPFMPTVLSLAVKIILLPFRLLAALLRGIGSVFRRRK